MEGGFGAAPVGGLGGEGLELSGSELYDGSLSAPVSTPPPVFLSFGIPTPAKIPPSCGAGGIDSAVTPPPSLLLLNLFAALDPGTGGANPAGGFPKPGTGGAPPTGGPLEAFDDLSITGADRSFVTAFFNLVPFVISPSSAP